VDDHDVGANHLAGITMKTRSRDQGRTAGGGSVKRTSPGFGAMGEKRRKPTITAPASSASVNLKADRWPLDKVTT
jgi:hypothetical protein